MEETKREMSLAEWCSQLPDSHRAVRELQELEAKVKRVEEALIECPWPEDMFTMTDKEYFDAVPDPCLRSRISGINMRFGWNLALQRAKQALEESE